MNKSIAILAAFIVFFSFNAGAQVKVNRPAPEIALPDLQGDTLKLSELKGKVVLVDFWASWCGPCRMNNPNLVRIYAKYKDMGFEIYGVSIDKSPVQWEKAIKKDKIEFLQVFDSRGWEAPVTYTYGVDAIPASFLLDKNGIIKSINPSGRSLEKKITDLLETKDTVKAEN